MTATDLVPLSIRDRFTGPLWPSGSARCVVHERGVLGVGGLLTVGDRSAPDARATEAACSGQIDGVVPDEHLQLPGRSSVQPPGGERRVDRQRQRLVVDPEIHRDRLGTAGLADEVDPMSQISHALFRALGVLELHVGGVLGDDYCLVDRQREKHEVNDEEEANHRRLPATTGLRRWGCRSGEASGPIAFRLDLPDVKRSGPSVSAVGSRTHPVERGLRTVLPVTSCSCLTDHPVSTEPADTSRVNPAPARGRVRGV